MKKVFLVFLFASSLARGGDDGPIRPDRFRNLLNEYLSSFTCFSKPEATPPFSASPFLEISLPKNSSSGTFILGRSSRSLWKLSRNGDHTLINVLAPHDSTLVISVSDVPENKYLQTIDVLRGSRHFVESGVDKYEVLLRAAVPFEMSIRNGLIRFYMLESKYFLTCNTPLDRFGKKKSPRGP